MDPTTEAEASAAPQHSFTSQSDEENSDDTLKIVIDNSPARKRKLPPKPTKNEQLIIDSIEEELEKQLGEKAEKVKLTASNVKNIIKHVVTNEHVLALLKRVDSPELNEESLTLYEPKLTRAKAKELFENNTIPPVPVPWVTSIPKPSKTHVLIGEDLQEDSSGDEYVPGEESEDDRDGSVVSESDPPSVPPATPPTPVPTEDCSTQTNWTEDGVFKIPQTKSPKTKEEEANIALRTRSKINLSSTPLEVIEKAFIPPDITTDMYDMDCDDDDWKEFLKGFTQPLDEIIKSTEEEEQDPEYNFLSEVEEITKTDIREELRVDKAVKITKKELNLLWEELFDYAEMYSKENRENNGNNSEQQKTGQDETVDPRLSEMVIRRDQVLLIEQQIRQHVQMLTQNFLLSYQHPEFHEHSTQLKEYLLNLKLLSEGKPKSVFRSCNLLPALELVDNWEVIFQINGPEVREAKMHVEKVLSENVERYRAGIYGYIPTFPNLILKTISESEVFLFPSLLPKIPLKSQNVFSTRIAPFTESEDQLIALGLEQFQDLGTKSFKCIVEHIREYMMPHKTLYKIQRYIDKRKDTRCANNPIKYYFQHKRAPPVLHYIFPSNELVAPSRRTADELPYQWKQYLYPDQTITKSITGTTNSAYSSNTSQPHIVTCNTSEKYILPKTPVASSTPVYCNKKTTRTYNKPLFKRRKFNGATEKNNSCSTFTPLSNFIKCLRQPSSVQKLIGLFTSEVDTPNESFNRSIDETIAQYKHKKQKYCNMLPSMPSLTTPIKDSLDKNEETPVSSSNECLCNADKSQKLEFTKISSKSFQQADTGTEVEFSKANTSFNRFPSKAGCSKTDSNGGKKVSFLAEQNTPRKNMEDFTDTKNMLLKDNLEDINALMIASSTVKTTDKKQPSGAEKKRAKLRREFLANLAIAAPEDPETEKEQAEMFAVAYYDKLREILELDDYNKIMQILNSYVSGDAVDLYRKIDVVLRPKYKELADEFLLFLREREAAAVGKLIPWVQMNVRSKFLRKMHIYFKDQPSQVKKIYNCLNELSQTVGLTIDKVKNTLLPMLKGNAILTDLFLQNFLAERPPASLMDCPFETIDINKEMARPEGEEIYESIVVPDTEDKFGGASCYCKCHKIEDPEFKLRIRHCIPCGLKFIQGKLYIQTGKGLRPAAVSFMTNGDHNARLMGKPATSSLSGSSQRKKRSDNSPSKPASATSPSKENQEEESDEELESKKKSKRLRSPSKRKKQPSKSGMKDIKSPSTSKKHNRDSSGSPREAKPRKRSCSVRKIKKEEKKTEKEIKQEYEEDQLLEEIIDCDSNCLGENETVIELHKPNSPGMNTAESESEFCEYSSQDVCESDSSSESSTSNVHSQSDSNTNDEFSPWKKDEDRIILETFQRENDKEYAFRMISSKLKDRTIQQIRNRFSKLMALLLEQIGDN